MKNWWGSATAAGLGCAVAFGVGSEGVDAQEGGGFTITGGYSSELEINDNKSLNSGGGNTSATWKNGVKLGLTTETPVSRLSLNTDLALRFEDSSSGSGSTELTDPNLDLNYRRQGVDSELRFRGRISTREISDFILIDADDDFVADDLIFDQGDLTQTRVSASFATGIGTPLRFDVSVSSNVRDYEGTVNPDLFDTTTLTAQASATALVTDNLTARGFVRATEYDASDADSTLRQTTTLGAGFVYDLRPDLRLDAQVATNEFETTTVGIGVVTVNERSLDGSVSVTRDLPDGTLTGRFSSDASPNTLRNTARVDRVLEFPDRQIRVGGGVSASDSGDTTFVATLAYAQELPDGRLTLAVSRNAVIESTDEEIAITRLTIDYLREVSPTSSLGVTFGLGDTDDIGFGAGDGDARGELTVTYRREVNEEWNWALGVRAGYANRSGGSATSTGVFARIERDFTLRP
jgi:hypothetical protein